LDRVKREVPTSALAHAGMGATSDSLRARCAALQEYVDDLARGWIKMIPAVVFSTETALAATRDYDGAWFRSRLWSDDVKREAAKAFVAAARPFPTVDVSVWKTIAEAE